MLRNCVYEKISMFAIQYGSNKKACIIAGFFMEFKEVRTG
jgi:hypothetical protein